MLPRLFRPISAVSRRETPTTLLASHRLRLHLAPSPRSWQRFCRHRLAVIALIFLTLLILLCSSAYFWQQRLGVDPTIVDLFHRLQPANSRNLLGTDELGRDIALRLLYGGQISLLVGIVGAILATTVGTFLGLLAGYRGGWVEILVMRLADGLLSLPILPLLIVLASLDGTVMLTLLLQALQLENHPFAEYVLFPFQSDWGSVLGLIALIACLGWPLAARLVYTATRNICCRPFIKGAEAIGATPTRILWRHVLPHVLSASVIAATLGMGNIILLESVLSFLGLGIRPPLASWGSLLTNAQELTYTAPYLAIFPGGLILLTALSCNLIGDGLADALNPEQV